MRTNLACEASVSVEFSALKRRFTSCSVYLDAHEVGRKRKKGICGNRPFSAENSTETLASQGRTNLDFNEVR